MESNDIWRTSFFVQTNKYLTISLVRSSTHVNLARNEIQYEKQSNVAIQLQVSFLIYAPFNHAMNFRRRHFIFRIIPKPLIQRYCGKVGRVKMLLLELVTGSEWRVGINPWFSLGPRERAIQYALTHVYRLQEEVHLRPRRKLSRPTSRPTSVLALSLLLYFPKFWRKLAAFAFPWNFARLPFASNRALASFHSVTLHSRVIKNLTRKNLLEGLEILESFIFESFCQVIITCTLVTSPGDTFSFET